MKSRTALACLCAFFVVGSIVPCSGQSPGPSSEDLVNAAMRVRNTAERAEKIWPNGIKHCRWSPADVTLPSFDEALSELLSKPNRIVPEWIPPSKIFRVSFVTIEMENELGVGVLHCALLWDREARDQFVDAAAIHHELIERGLKLTGMAIERTLSLEERNWSALKDSARDDSEVRSLREDTIVVARDVSAILRDTERLEQKASPAAGCLASDLPSGRSDSTQLEDLFISGRSSTLSYVPATALWTAFRQLEGARLSLFGTLLACSGRVEQKRKAKELESETLKAYGNLRRLSGKLAAIALKQTEWEEQQTSHDKELRDSDEGYPERS